MPELPEADASRLTLERHCLHRTIEEVTLGDSTDHIDLPGADARGRLVGHQFTRTHRHGKLIFTGSKTGPWILVHLGMTGRLVAFDAGEDVPEYTKLLFVFEGDRRLAFRCPRKFGWVRVVDSPEAFLKSDDGAGYGPDALEIGEDAFCATIGQSRGALKSALMAQEKVSGIGNLWSDEILFQLGIPPEAKGTDLSDEALSKLHAKTNEVLRAVIATEATYSKLPDDWLISHREAGSECRRCGGTIKKKKVGGRSAYHCPGHQG